MNMFFIKVYKPITQRILSVSISFLLLFSTAAQAVNSVATTFVVKVPATTPADAEVYITGSFDEWSGGIEKFKLHKRSERLYEITLTREAGEEIQYKFTQGSWISEELDNEAGPRGNREYTFTANTKIIEHNIPYWLSPIKNDENLISDSVVIPGKKANLSGVIYRKKDVKAKHAIVLVHGSGYGLEMEIIAQHMAMKGFTVLYYDKRGIGSSEGKYNQKTNAGKKNLKLLASDAAAAYKILKNYVGDVATGFVGVSQAGWIVPLAAEQVKPDFIALFSGPVCSVGEELRFSKMAEETKDFWKTHKREDINNLLKSGIYLYKGIDSYKTLKHLDNVSGLWIFGAQDRYMPADLSIERLASLQQEYSKPYEFKVYEKYGHSTQLPGMESFDYLSKWIKNHKR